MGPSQHFQMASTFHYSNFPERQVLLGCKYFTNREALKVTGWDGTEVKGFINKSLPLIVPSLSGARSANSKAFCLGSYCARSSRLPRTPSLPPPSMLAACRLPAPPAAPEQRVSRSTRCLSSSSTGFFAAAAGAGGCWARAGPTPPAGPSNLHPLLCGQPACWWRANQPNVPPGLIQRR